MHIIPTVHTFKMLVYCLQRLSYKMVSCPRGQDVVVVVSVIKLWQLQSKIICINIWSQ